MEMEFHGMKRKDLQSLCKKHGIPANLKNVEMANRLASLLQTETVAETVVVKEGKKVTFSPENEVFEFTRSVKKRYVRNSSGVEVRRSTRVGAKGKTVAGSEENELSSGSAVVEVEKVRRRSNRIGSSGSSEEECKGIEGTDLEQFEREDMSKGLCGNSQDGLKVDKVRRRSTRLRADVVESCVGGETSKAGDLVPAKRTRRREDSDREEEIVKNNVKEVFVGLEVQETGKNRLKDVKDDSKAEKVRRQSRRFANDIDVKTNAQGRRRSVRLKASDVNPNMGGGISDGRDLCSDMESKEGRKRKQSKGSVAVSSQEAELVKSKTMEPMIDCEVQRAEKVQEVSNVEKVTRRSKRDKRPLVGESVKGVKRDDLEVKKAPKKSRQLEKRVTESLVDGQAEMGDKQPKRTSENDCEPEQLVRCSKRTAMDNLVGKVMNTSPASVQLAASNPEVELVVPTGHILVTDIASTVIVEESTKTKDPTPELEERSSAAKSVEAEAILENSSECWKNIYLINDAEKGSSEIHLQEAKLHDNFSQCNTENSSAKEGTEISKVGYMSVGYCENLTPASGSFKNSPSSKVGCKSVGYCDNAQGMAEKSPSTFETSAIESVMISENVFNSTPKVSGLSSVGEELNSELVEGKSEGRHELDTVLMTETENDKEEASSPLVLHIESSDVKTCQQNRSTGGYQCVESRSNPEAELRISTDHVLVKNIVSTVITEEDVTTKEETLVCTPRSELKEHTSVAYLEKVEVILENSAECYKEIHARKNDEEGSSEKDLQAANSHGNFSEYITENSSAEEGMEMSVGHCVNLTQEKLLDAYTQLDPEEAGGSNVEARTVNQECITGRPMAIYANELNYEPMEEEREEKQEQDTILMAVTEDKEEASSLSVSLIESSEAEVYVKITPRPASVQLAASNPEAKLDVPTDGILLKDSASTVTAEEDIKTKEEFLTSIPRSELKEHDVVAELAEPEAECWNEILRKDDEKGSSEKEIQAEKLQGDFSEYNAENSSEKEQEDISKVCEISAGRFINMETVDEVEDDSLENSERTISSEQGCKLNTLELTETSKRFLEDEVTASPQPVPRNESASVFDESAIFTTPERNLMLMEQFGKSGKTRAPNSVIPQNGATVESHAVVFTAAEKDLLLGDFGRDEAGKEDEHTATNIPYESDLLSTSDRHFMLSRNEGENTFVELYDGSDMATSPVRQFSVGDFKGQGIGGNEENRTLEFHCESGARTCEESFVFTSPERRLLLGNSKQQNAKTQERMEVELKDKSAFFSSLDTDKSAPSPEVNLMDNSGADELIEAKNTERDYEGNLILASSGGSGKTSFLAGTEDEHSGFGSEVLLRNTFEISGGKFLEAEGTEKAIISLTSNEVIVDNGTNEKDEEMLKRQTTQSPEETFNDSSQNMVYLNEKVADEETIMREATISPENTLEESSSENRKEILNIGKSEFHDESAVSSSPDRPPFPEDSGLDEAAKSEEIKALELRADSGIFTGAMIHLQLEADEETKADNITAKSHYTSDDIIAPESHLGDSESGEAENKSVELSESHSLSSESGLNETREIEATTVATCEESFVFTSPERLLLLEKADPHNAETQERKEVEMKDESASFSRLDIGNSDLSQYQSHHAPFPNVNLMDDSVIRGTPVASLDLSEKEIAASGSIASKFYSHEFNIGKETSGAESISKGSQAEDVVGLDATPGILNGSRGCSPLVDSVNPFDFDSEGEETIMEAERNTSLSSYVLALPAKGYFETVGEISSHLEVAETCSMISEEAGPSTCIQNQINIELEELAKTENEADKLIEEASETKKSLSDHEGNLMLDSSGGSYVSGNTNVFAGTEDEHLGSHYEVVFEKSGGKFIEDQAIGLIATASVSVPTERAASLTWDEFTVQNSRNEKVENKEADELTEASDREGNLMLDCSGSSYVSGNTNVLAGTEDVHLGSHSEVCEKSGGQFLEDKAVGPIATTSFDSIPTEKTISMTSDDFTLENSRNEKAADEEKETTPSPEETSENLNIDESGMLSAKQVRREPIFIYGTQMKPKTHDMKENAPNSKIVVDHLNVTAPRTSKRQPLQDLKKKS